MGSDKTKDKLAYDDETPQHTLHLPEYRIARVPVTVAQFAAFMAANPRYRTTAEQQGSAWSWTGSKWEDVKAPTGRTRAGRRAMCGRNRSIPSPASRGTTRSRSASGRACGCPPRPNGRRRRRGTETGTGDGRIWPWGDREPNSGLCNFNMTVGDTTPVGRYPDGKSPYGLLDVAGNVWEWTSSLWGTDVSKPEFGYPYDAEDGRENPSAPDTVLRTLRGGSFGNVAQDVRCAFRLRGLPIDRNDDLGFRVVSPGF